MAKLLSKYPEHLITPIAPANTCYNCIFHGVTSVHRACTSEEHTSHYWKNAPCNKFIGMEYQTITQCTRCKSRAYPMEDHACSPELWDKYRPTKFCEEPCEQYYDGWMSTPKSTKSYVCRLWGIDREMDLLKETATFYTYNYLSFVNHSQAEKCKMKSMMLATNLAHQFLPYIIMASGGESRHYRRKIYCDNIAYDLGQTKAGKDFKKIQFRYSDDDNRTVFWYGFYHYYKKWGMEALDTIYTLFHNYEWDGGYGDKPWADIVDTARKKLNGFFPTDTMFVDTVYGLAHHGGLCLDKIWCIDKVKYIFDQAFNSRIYRVAYYANDEAKELYARYCRENGQPLKLIDIFHDENNESVGGYFDE